jgi:hypothetical protein
LDVNFETAANLRETDLDSVPHTLIAAVEGTGMGQTNLTKYEDYAGIIVYLVSVWFQSLPRSTAHSIHGSLIPQSEPHIQQHQGRVMMESKLCRGHRASGLSDATMQVEMQDPAWCLLPSMLEAVFVLTTGNLYMILLDGIVGTLRFTLCR